jgi:Na+/H+ antiporter NhaA
MRMVAKITKNKMRKKKLKENLVDIKLFFVCPVMVFTNLGISAIIYRSG